VRFLGKSGFYSKKNFDLFAGITITSIGRSSCRLAAGSKHDIHLTRIRHVCDLVLLWLMANVREDGRI
jgi:hypothetical protein